LPDFGKHASKAMMRVLFSVALIADPCRISATQHRTEIEKSRKNNTTPFYKEAKPSAAVVILTSTERWRAIVVKIDDIIFSSIRQLSSSRELRN
jgi:hypothetical protein